MLRWRLLLGTLIVAALVALVWLDHRAARAGVFLLPLALAVSLLASQEVLRLFATRKISPASWVVYAGNISIVLANGVSLWSTTSVSAWHRVGYPLAVYAVVLLVAIVEEIRRYQRPGGSMERLAASAFAIGYVGVLLSFLSQLRLLAGGGDGVTGRLGLVPLVSLIAVVKCTDTGAYAFGRMFGKHKMSPVISPGKTWEGFAGGMCTALVAAWITLGTSIVTLKLGMDKPLDLWRCLFFGIVVGGAGVIGDLAESLLKRDAGVKDSSNWMPGFGGVLDLLDSLLFAAPIAWLFWVCCV